jgi:plastocyanin
VSSTTGDRGTTSRHPTSAGSRHANGWLRSLVLLSALVALGDVVLMTLISQVIPPLALGVVLTLVGIGLQRVRPRVGIAVLGLTSLVLALVAVLFLSPHLGHPGSPVDFLHAVLSIAGRALATIAGVGAWRGATAAGARRLAAGALGVASAAVAVSAVAVLTLSDDAVQPGDLRVVVAGSQFPPIVTVEEGQTLHLDNQDVFRHTFAVSDTDLDVDLPATTAVRVSVELPPGSYEVICDLAGHEHMTAVLMVDRSTTG